MNHKGSGLDAICGEYAERGGKFVPYACSDDYASTRTLPDLTHTQGIIVKLDCPEVYTSETLGSSKGLKILFAILEKQARPESLHS